jgi:hypothetical protein
MVVAVLMVPTFVAARKVIVEDIFDSLVLIVPRELCFLVQHFQKNGCGNFPSLKAC